MKFTKSRWNTFLSLCPALLSIGEAGIKLIDRPHEQQEPERSPSGDLYFQLMACFNHGKGNISTSPELFLVLDWFLSSLSYRQYAERQGWSQIQGFLNIPRHIKHNLWLAQKKKSCPHVMLGFCTYISWGGDRSPYPLVPWHWQFHPKHLMAPKLHIHFPFQWWQNTFSVSP